jgi:hypothetical protein
MLVDGGAAVNVMPYATFKKLGKTDAELIKTNMTLTGIGGDGPIGHQDKYDTHGHRGRWAHRSYRHHIDGAHHRKQNGPHCVLRHGGIR